ncbi:MAG: hypoxanthine-guanine phosphoribosyltransferase [Gammaproteobacteria bacterium]|nr:hypoxanthine-guanine phosphoribosyltransferase [Gammaproteobacteria bacterium]
MSITAEQAQQVLNDADCLYTLAEVEKAILDVAQKINYALHGKNPLVLCVMSGGVVTVGQLLPHFSFTMNLDYIHATRYADKTVGGELQWLVKPRTSLKDRVVLIIDDILDEGETLKAIISDCENASAQQVYSAVLVNKVHDRKADVKVDFVGLDVEDRYVFGYGMDYKGYLRNAPGIFAENLNELAENHS